MIEDAPAPPPAVTSLVALLTDAEGAVRRRAALGVGRAGLAAGTEPLSKVLASDGEPEVRAMAAFAHRPDRRRRRRRGTDRGADRT